MEEINELLDLFLPAGILEYFEYEGYERKSKEESKPYGELTIILAEKNVVPMNRENPWQHFVSFKEQIIQGGKKCHLKVKEQRRKN